MARRLRPSLHRWLWPLLAALALVSLAPRAALAVEYEVFIDIDNEDELYDLYITNQIDEDTFNTLTELMRRGVDLNSASRDELYTLPNLTYTDVDAILAYREEAGVIHAPSDLLAAGVLSEAKLGSILLFVRAYAKRPKLTATHGSLRYQTNWATSDRMVPPMALEARVTTLRQLTLGFAGILSRQRPGAPVWDPNREALIAAPMAVRVNAPKAFAQWDTDRFGVIVGSYRAGFGQRLTFDTTNRYTPNGFYFDTAVNRYTDLGSRCREVAGELPATPCESNEYVTKDMRWRDGQRGVAIGAKHLSLPVGWLQLYGFGSWQTRQIYQYQVVDADRCEDLLSDADACSSVPTFVDHDDQDPLAPTSGHRYQTLPNIYDEFLGGANMTWFHDRRTHLGVTGYGATALWRADGAELDFSKSASSPFGGPWGAVGVDATWGRGWSDLGVELARSFDSMATRVDPDADYGGGGYAGILRHTTTLGPHELELTARWYGEAYANPYAGPISQADQLHGNRARDEAGGRARYRGRIADRLDLRAQADIWTQPRADAVKMIAYVRGDVDVNRWFRPGLWLQYRTADFRPTELGCFTNDLDTDNPFDTDTSSLRSGCISELGQVTGRLGFRPLRKRNKLSITAQYQHEVMREATLTERLRQDASAFLIVRANPVSSFRIASRIRYVFEDIADNTRREQFIWAYLDLSYVIAKMMPIHVRYDLFQWLDQRSSTMVRVPNPEHRFRLVVELRF